MSELPKCSALPKTAFEFYFDLYKLRAEEYRSRYESMRALEWNTLLQVYAGYGAIALSYGHLAELFKDDSFHIGVISSIAMAGTICFYCAGRYMTYRIQERLMRFNGVYGQYMKAMHDSLDLDILEVSPPLKHRYFWTYHAQLLLSTATLTGLLLYEELMGFSKNPDLTTVLVFGTCVLGLAAFVVGWFNVPPNK